MAIMQSGDYRVFLAHFIMGNVFVKAGDIVTAGQPLGLAGNSGFSAEPHLHINVFKNYDTEPYDEAHASQSLRKRRDMIYDDYRYSGTSYPFTFDGKYYVINDVMTK
jgi:murein DD-endopeptidase MepM/ murein hydrolase activator NlpD